jgi:putative DNA primase/helicase
MTDIDRADEYREWIAGDERREQAIRNGRHPDDPGPLEPPAEDDSRPQFPAPSAPLDVARKVYLNHRDVNGARTLVAWRGGWMRWCGPHWVEMDTAELRSELYELLGAVDYLKPITDKGQIVDWEPSPWNPDKRKVANVMEAMGAVGHLNADLDPPAWIGPHSADRHPAAQMIGCTNGVLDLATREVHAHTPTLFNTVSVPFDYDPHTEPPAAWLQFLNSVWPADEQSIALLQEYVGYLLSGRTDMQKMLLLIGPTRSGKGTIARMLAELVGRGHVAGPTLASLGTNFGLSPLLGKPLAIVSDARLGNAPADTVVERLLSITGEDMLTVDRKFKEPWSGRLSTRFVILSNELPKFRDASGAIANRLLILQMTESFLGREDRALDKRLRGELPGILTWALQGLDRLIRNNRFTVPSSSDDATNLMMDLASPVSAFVRERCRRGPSEDVSRDGLYDAWKAWAEDNGHRAGEKSTFGRDIRAVVPEAKVTQPRTGDGRARMYVGIGLLPVPPVPGSESAGQGESRGDTFSEPSYAASVQEELPEPGGTGCVTPVDAVKPQVNGCGTGGTGKSAFKAVPGGLTERSPGQTDRMKQALAKASSASVQRCGACETELEAPESIAAGLCAECRISGRHPA